MDDVRLIDANALEFEPDQYNAFAMNAVAFAGRFGGKTAAMVQNALKHMIDNAPTIDAVEVVHGRWVETGKVFVHSMYDLFTKCSQCSFGHVRNEYQEPYRYCPNCGAKMDGGAEK